MKTKLFALSASLIATTCLWFYNEVSGDVCSAFDSACVDSVTVPCSGGQCAVTSGGIPGGTSTCTDRSTAAYYTASPPSSWNDCVIQAPQLGYGPCSRTSSVCETVKLYKTKTACQNDSTCNTTEDDECTNSSNQIACKGPPPG